MLDFDDLGSVDSVLVIAGEQSMQRDEHTALVGTPTPGHQVFECNMAGRR